MELGHKKSWKFLPDLKHNSESLLHLLSKTTLPSALCFTFCFLAITGNALSSEKVGPVSAKRQLALTHFDQAVQMRTALESKSKRLRTAAEYLKVINKFRSVYYTAPGSPKADEALMAVSELFQMMANDFKDSKYFYQAIKAYGFLEKEYPSSPYVADALFTTAEIYLNDLGDPRSAQELFKDLLKRYPQSSRSRNARARLEDLREELKQGKKSAPKTAPPAVSSLTIAAKEDPLANSEKRDTNHSVLAQPPLTQIDNNTKQTRVVPRKEQSPVVIKNVRFWSSEEVTRLVVDASDETRYVEETLENPSRVFLDIQDARLSTELLGKTFSINNGYLRQVRFGQAKEKVARIVLDLAEIKKHRTLKLQNPFRIVVDIQGSAKNDPEQASIDPAKQSWRIKRGELLPDELSAISPFETTKEALEAKRAPLVLVEDLSGEKELDSKLPPASAASRNETPRKHFDTISKKAGDPKKANIPEKKEAENLMASREAQPKSDGTLSLIRTLGLKVGRIVIDPGHGGYDTGTIGPSGLHEKELVLDVSLRLKKLVEEKLNGEVVLTRTEDIFIPLEDRTALANQCQADLFISIHANSSRNPRVSGVETFFLNFATSTDIEEIAARENASSQKTVFELQDLVQKIALKEKVEESKEFAQIVQKSMAQHLQKTRSSTKDRGVKQAPFIVLIGANMPSILSEISFVSNPSDEKLLKSPSYRQKVAQALCKGIEDYIRNLSGLKTAQNIGH